MQPRIVRPSEITPLSILGIEHRVLLSGEESGGALAVVDVIVPPGLGIPAHVHTREDEVFHVQDGRLEFTIAGRRHDAASGTAVHAPRGVPHAFRAVDGAARFLVAITPAGIEPMFAELARLPAGPPDMERIAGICGRYGITFV